MSTSASANHVLQLARRRFTQKSLAELLEVSPRTVARWENGETSLSGVRLLALRHIVAENEDSLRQDKESAGFTFIDLFAGIGGTRLGFEAAGGHCVFTSEWDKQSQRTYAANFTSDHAIAGDITQVDPATIPDHDVLVGGFPCQPFSIAGVSKKNSLGTPHGFACKTQGTLFFEIARILETKRPPAFMLENVKNLQRHDRGRTFEVIRHTLEAELDYRIHFRVIDAKHFVPQHRERIFIVGFRNDTGFEWDDLHLPSIERGPRLNSILHPQDGSEAAEEPYTSGDRAEVNPKYTLTDHLWNYLQAYAAKHRAKGNGFGYGLVGPDDVARTLSARYYKDGSEILIDQGPNKNPRRLTPRECARIMGFPETFEIPVSDTQAYKQFGNSVAVPVIKRIASVMKPHVLAVREGKALPSRQRKLFR